MATMAAPAAASPEPVRFPAGRWEHPDVPVQRRPDTHPRWVPGRDIAPGPQMETTAKAVVSVPASGMPRRQAVQERTTVRNKNSLENRTVCGG